MKHSLILHPPGARFVRIDLWVVDALGGKAHAAAACLSLLEFWQRTLPPGNDSWVRRTIDNFVEALGGLYGKNVVGGALRTLKDSGWIESEQTNKLMGQTWQHETKYRLNFDKINSESEKYSTESKRVYFSPLGEFKNKPSEDLKINSPRGEKSTVANKEVSILYKSSSYAAAADSIFVLENEQDQLLINALIDKHGLNVVEAEAKAIIEAGKVRPYPSNIKKSLSQKAAAARREAAEARKEAALAAPLAADAETFARGKAALDAIRRRNSALITNHDSER
ncbi:MAG: hypothetical protein WC091_01975 [Sulfuricellaceae bacterium]